MNTAIVVTLIICGTIITVTLIGIFFAGWIISKGIEMQKGKS